MFINKIRNIPLAAKVSLAYAICNIFQRCLSFITMPLFTRLLTTEQYGQYTIYQSWLGILTIFITLNLAYGSFNTAMIKYEKDRDAYISSIQSIAVLLACIFLVIYFPLKKYWNTLFELPTFFIIVMVFEILFGFSINIWTAKQRFEYKYINVIISTLILTIVSPIIALFFVLISEERGYARIVGYSSVYIILGAIFFIYNLLKGKKIFQKEYWKYALGFNIPLIAYYLSQVVFNQSDRIMINKYCGASEAAIYGVAYNLAMILTFVLNAINGAYVPWYYERIKQGKTSENKKISLMISAFIALLIIGVIWYAPEVIYVMAGNEYTEAIPVVAPVAISLLLLFYSQLFINLEFYYEEKKSLVYASIGAAVINIVLNAILIPKTSFVIAGYTTLLSYLLFAICNYFASKRIIYKHNIKDESFDITKLVSLFILFVIVSFIGVALYDYLLIRIIITLIVLFVIFIYRNKLLSVFKQIKGK